jgi:formate C-acetyltransferase
MNQVVQAFGDQVDFMVNRLLKDIRVIEKANRDFHPTPFSSMLVEGCLESGNDVTAGGARFNSSGIQGVGVADVADSLTAIEEVVFHKKSYSLEQMVKAMKDNFKADAKMRKFFPGGKLFAVDNEWR